MKTILVPVDFSKNATNALEYAAALAKEKKMKLIILHAFQAESATTKPKENKLLALCNKIETTNGIICDFINVEGILFDVIIDTINAIEPDFIIMGTKGSMGLKEILLGSNAERIIKNSKCPVIIIPKKETFKNISAITYATTYYSCDTAVLLQLIEIAKTFNAKINVIEICDEECMSEEVKNYMGILKRKINETSDFKAISYDLVFGNNEQERLDDFLIQTSSNILAISAKNRILTEKLFHNKGEYKSVNKRSTPIMVLHDEIEIIKRKANNTETKTTIISSI